jgi:hypothetical protein
LNRGGQDFLESQAIRRDPPIGGRLLFVGTDWEDEEIAGQAQASNPPLTTIDRSGGYATVRLNQTLYFNGSIWLQGQLSGSIPPGATFRGCDNNNNGIPDLLERLARERKIHFDG